MTYTFNKSNIRTIDQGDPNFLIVDGLQVANRASISITEDCPREYRAILARCFDNGWVKLSANVTEREMLFIGLS